MDSKRTDISQIRKYLNGELDANAMHRLEREAQDDPFLMDALEGYGVKPVQQPNLAGLHTRLQQRTGKQQARIIPFWYWGVAASVLIVLGIGTFWYQHNATQPAVLVAQADKTNMEPPAVTAPVTRAAPTLTKPAQPAVYDAEKTRAVAGVKPPLGHTPLAVDAAAPNSIAAYPAEMTREAAKQKDSAQDLSDRVMTGLINQKKNEQEIADTKVAIDTSRKYQVALNSRVRGVQTSPNYNAPKQPVIISGVVISKDDGLPIPGVNIRVLGTTTGTQTDASGKFAITGAKDKTVSIASIGYNTEQVNLRGKDSLKVALSPSSSSLNEVVVTGKPDEPNGEVQPYAARPQQGWGNFRRYLKAGGIAINGREGTVKLQFEVSPNGRVTNIKVNKSLDAVSDQKAIDLISNGPGWYGNTNKKPEVVKVKVAFKKANK